jgi:hypothetical protein
MWKDPIVEEIRKNAEKLALPAQGNRQLFIQQLRINQRKSGRKVVSFSAKNSIKVN